MQRDGNAHVARAGSPAARDCPCAHGGTGKRSQQLLPVQSKGELQPLFHNSKLCSQVGVLQGEEGRGSPAGHVCSRAGPRRLLQALTQGQALPRSPCPMSHAPRCRLLDGAGATTASQQPLQKASAHHIQDKERSKIGIRAGNPKLGSAEEVHDGFVRGYCHQRWICFPHFNHQWL